MGRHNDEFVPLNDPRARNDRTWSRRRERERVHGRTAHLLTTDGRIACGRDRHTSGIHVYWRLEQLPPRTHACLTCARLAERLEREGRLVPPPPTPEQLAADRAAAREERRAVRLARWLESQRVAA